MTVYVDNDGNDGNGGDGDGGSNGDGDDAAATTDSDDVNEDYGGDLRTAIGQR